MLIRISSSHFVYMSPPVNCDNEESILASTINDTEQNQLVMTDKRDDTIFNELENISNDDYPIDLRIESKKVVYIHIYIYII